MIIWSHIGEFGRNLSTILAALSFARLTRNTGLRVSPSCLGKSLPVFRRSDPEQTAGQSFRRYLKNNKETIDVVTSDIDEAVRGADYIFICVPGNRHEEYAKLLKGHTTADQIVITFNGCMASLIYKNVWGDDDTCPVFVESTIPPFSTRRVEPGKVRMFERHLAPIAFFPASAADKYYDRIIADIYEFPGKFEDVLECGLSLVNPTVHPGPCLVNLSNIEKPDFTFFLYEHGSRSTCF